eukprot:CAMPEP_0194025902 /NCGR_PEP_ID=MMETSP0009_2-20130614/190_1 /TAXON_ID=210454 /ORGANISM="Grammatophora oceanica, Strain CCMP 410" /LENGTH=175 /DNA_ID=CAMNT_0038664287 /DNA_START=35 /DNA_END=562 /DNA_ORIENTATION=-
MEWPFPIATTPPSLRSGGRFITAVNAYASVDRIFARDFEKDDYLKAVFAELKAGNTNDSDPAFRSASHVIARALINRADLAIEMKLALRRKMEKALELGQDTTALLADVGVVQQEVEMVYSVLDYFSGIINFEQNLYTLKLVRDRVKIPTEYKEDDDDQTVTEEEEDSATDEDQG